VQVKAKADQPPMDADKSVTVGGIAVIGASPNETHTALAFGFIGVHQRPSAVPTSSAGHSP
jgi:hypothetical protein